MPFRLSKVAWLVAPTHVITDIYSGGPRDLSALCHEQGTMIEKKQKMPPPAVCMPQNITRILEVPMVELGGIGQLDLFS